MKKLVIGILAHVDAGKTTLAEGILYLTGSIRKLGRVDHKDAFLDTYELERERGITIFSKQAVFKSGDMDVTLLDTPGHADFSAEMERTLQVLDYAVLVINGSDGVQGHTQTLWRLLSHYRVPTFIFVNKMDLDGTNRRKLIDELKKQLNDGCIDFSADNSSKPFLEGIALCDETLLDKYIDGGIVDSRDIAQLISSGKVFPCYFGSALKLEGVKEFLDGLSRYTKSPEYREDFGAKVYKVIRDEQGSRLTFMKITGGSLRVKLLLTNRNSGMTAQSNSYRDNISYNGNRTPQSVKNNSEDENSNDIWEEKVDQIRIYSGAGYTTADEARAGTVCAVTGLSATFPGEGLGMESVSAMPVLEPVLNYQILLPPGCSAYNMFSQLRLLEEEDPQLHIIWSEQLKEIHVKLMGEVQVEILKSLILERFGINVELSRGNIVYKETIAEPVEGVGHFEPLRHYAEVHLLLEPGEPGSGLSYDTRCSEDELEGSWQRLILTHLQEKEHIGALTGSPITDMMITLIGGRAHQKHTEGGDFRQATYRALRQGLMKAESVLLEPYYDFRLEIPSELVGRAMSDIQRMSGSFNSPELQGETALMTGCVPVAAMSGYQIEVAAYSGGRGRLSCVLRGYFPCHNPEEVIKEIAYDSVRDFDNPASSVFCAHGAGFIVNWDKVEDYMHVESSWKPQGHNEEGIMPATVKQVSYTGSIQEDKELEEIFTRTYGPVRQKLKNYSGSLGYEKKPDSENTDIKPRAIKRSKEPMDECLIVDGYNIIFSWEELNELAKENMDAARSKLMDMLCNYQGFRKCMLILVFDAWKVKEGKGSVQDYHNIHVVYTKEAETADQYIERVTHEIADKYRVTVATSDALEQIIIMGKGAIRLSSGELKEELLRTVEQIRRDYLDRPAKGRSFLGEQMNNVTKISDDNFFL